MKKICNDGVIHSLQFEKYYTRCKNIFISYKL